MTLSFSLKKNVMLVVESKREMPTKRERLGINLLNKLIPIIFQFIAMKI